MSAGRIALVLIGLGVVVAASVMLRRQDVAERPSVTQKAGLLSRDVPDSTAPGGPPARQARERPASTAGDKPARSTEPERRPASSGRSDGQAEGVVIGSRPRVGSAEVDDQRRAEAARNLPDRGARVAAEEPGVDDSWRDDLPPGTRFAATFQGAATAADGSQPVVDKNTEPDGNDGLYFPIDAELAYPNRAGVEGDAGTIALWVEPVDWAGGDASVHSFFRVNDPAEGGYRFHLLKDAASLRFQFVTEMGETNVRVPIEWWPRGEGHHVAATWDSNVLRLFVDGVPLAEQPYEGTLRVPASALGWWGSNLASGTRGAGAVLKDTLIAERPFVDSEIQGLSQPN